MNKVPGAIITRRQESSNKDKKLSTASDDYPEAVRSLLAASTASTCTNDAKADQEDGKQRRTSKVNKRPTRNRF